MADGVGIALEVAELEQGAATAWRAAEEAGQVAADMAGMRVDPAAYGTSPAGVELAQALAQARDVIVGVATATQRGCADLAARAEAVLAMGDGLVADTTAVARRAAGPG